MRNVILFVHTRTHTAAGEVLCRCFPHTPELCSYLANPLPIFKYLHQIATTATPSRILGDAASTWSIIRLLETVQ